MNSGLLTTRDRNMADRSAEVCTLSGVAAEIHDRAIGGIDPRTPWKDEAPQSVARSQKSAGRHLAGADWLADWRQFFPDPNKPAKP